MVSTLTLADAKVELEKLIASGEVQYNRGLFGCCVKYYVTFPNDNHKYYYNRDKSISNKLRNFIFNLLYNMPPKSSKQNTPTNTDTLAVDLKFDKHPDWPGSWVNKDKFFEYEEKYDDAQDNSA